MLPIAATAAFLLAAALLVLLARSLDQEAGLPRVGAARRPFVAADLLVRLLHGTPDRPRRSSHA
ncbi:hypothetical protein BH10ACT1_BH10ACT1_43460 [soil metagenome]